MHRTQAWATDVNLKKKPKTYEKGILQPAPGSSALCSPAVGNPRLSVAGAPGARADPAEERRSPPVPGAGRAAPVATAPRPAVASPRRRAPPRRRGALPGAPGRAGRRGRPRLLVGGSCCCCGAAAAMPGSLKEETALLLEDYFQHRGGGSALPASPTAAALRRAAAELERRERPFFRSCAPLARAEPREAAALLGRVAEQLEADGGLNWGRLLALVVFAGTLAAALAERGCGEGPRCLAAALAAYLAEERGEWLEAHGGWVSGDRRAAAGGRGGSSPRVGGGDRRGTVPVMGRRGPGGVGSAGRGCGAPGLNHGGGL